MKCAAIPQIRVIGGLYAFVDRVEHEFASGVAESHIFRVIEIRELRLAEFME